MGILSTLLRSALAAPRAGDEPPEPGPATPNGHRSSSHDWPFPFPQPGRPRPHPIPSKRERRWPFVDMDAVDDKKIEPRHVPSPVSAEEFKRSISGFADDVGIIPVDDPAIAHELKEILYVYPHTKSLVVLIGEENKAAMQSRYLPSANHELYSCEERIFEMGRKTIRHINSLGGDGLSTTIGWPQEVSQRWADKIWPLSHKLVAQAAGLGVIGLSRNFLHRKFGAYCLIDTVLTNLEFPPEAYAKPIEWNPCIECNLCVASCPTDAIKNDGEFDFFACYNHTYRDSIPGFLDLVRDLAEASPKKFEKRWTDAEVAALWQSMAFKVEYRCFNCVATCPAEIHDLFHADKGVRRDYLAQALKPLSYTRRYAEEQFVIDTPGARDELGIPPGEWRTPVDPTHPTAKGVRLIPLQRIRTSNVDSMMRNMPHYFRSGEAKGLDFTCQFDLTGTGGGRWAMRVAGQRCEVRPGDMENPDLTVRCPATLYLAIHRGDASAVWALLLGRVRLGGDRRLFLTFPAIFAQTPGSTLFHRLAWHARRWWRRSGGAPRQGRGRGAA
ncbi:MAG: SCP2 sterol-binding domain-containing protein [Deltaproteobacteria bacterium]|nr:SCP2 sterol-binding domain-containing protein [Deltaproteobacteria bacterium]